MPYSDWHAAQCPSVIAPYACYDAANRLTQIQYRKADGSLIETLTYAYDPNGQRVVKSSAAPLVSETPMSAQYDEANRMTSLTLNPGTDNAKTYQLTHDASGNLERKQNLNDLADTTIYTWDERDRLTGIQAPGMNATFAYDAMGRRVERTVNGETTKYFYEGMQALGEFKAGSETRLLTGLMIDEMIARNTDQGQRTYLTDALGSVIAQAKEDQSLLNRYGYSPYGETTTTANDEGNSSQYTGRENDGTGLYYYRARYYDPVLKRFISEDPIGLAGGVNTYTYVGGNPLRWTDALGLDHLRYDGAALTLYGNDGQPINQWPAASGNPTSTPSDYNLHKFGPIPPGNYTVDPANIDRFEWWNPADYDWYGDANRIAWGNWRVPIEGGPRVSGRTGGYFIHGGANPGSAGCIDLTNQEDSFFDLLRQYSEPIPLTVDYRRIGH